MKMHDYRKDEVIKGSGESPRTNQQGSAEKKTVDFNGVQVTEPQYSRLQNLQNKVVALNGVIDTITLLGGGRNSASLQGNSKFRKLVRFRDRLRAFLPGGDLNNNI